MDLLYILLLLGLLLIIESADRTNRGVPLSDDSREGSSSKTRAETHRFSLIRVGDGSSNFDGDPPGELTVTPVYSNGGTGSSSNTS